MTKQLVLLGGGHAHLHVLARLGQRRLRDNPLEGWDVLLVTPQPRQIYSGMLPGWVAGHYALDQISVDLQALAHSAGVTLRLDLATGLDVDRGFIQTRDSGSIGFDALSIDIGSAPPNAIPGATEHGIGVRPIESFVRAWECLERQLHGTRQPVDAVILGAGPGGVELAFALRFRAMQEGWAHLNVHLVGSGPLPLPTAPPFAQRRVLDMLRQTGIHWHGSRRAAAIEPGRILFENGEAAPADFCWVVTGAAAPPLLAGSGLALDPGGFARVSATLQSPSHPPVFIAGDAASHPVSLPKSGVYAVRAGEVLAHNLFAFCAGEQLIQWQPQTRALYLISMGDRRALAIWGRWSGSARWVWHWKNWIDRRFIRITNTQLR